MIAQSEAGYDTLADYSAFKTELPSLLKDHRGEYAVFHDRKLIKVFPTLMEAMNFGLGKYGSRRFIAQEIKTQEPAVLYSLLI